MEKIYSKNETPAEMYFKLAQEAYSDAVTMAQEKARQTHPDKEMRDPKKRAEFLAKEALSNLEKGIYVGLKSEAAEKLKEKINELLNNLNGER